MSELCHQTIRHSSLGHGNIPATTLSSNNTTNMANSPTSPATRTGSRIRAPSPHQPWDCSNNKNPTCPRVRGSDRWQVATLPRAWGSNGPTTVRERSVATAQTVHILHKPVRYHMADTNSHSAMPVQVRGVNKRQCPVSSSNQNEPGVNERTGASTGTSILEGSASTSKTPEYHTYRYTKCLTSPYITL